MAKQEPLRQCVGCGERRGKRDLIRVVHTPEGEFCLDATGRKNGRGAYMCPNPECLQKARRKGGLDRSFRMQISPEVYGLLEEQLGTLKSEG